MSRINDALKRARQSPLKNPPDISPLMPVGSAVKTSNGMNRLLPAVVILLVAAAGIFLGLALFQRDETKIAVMPAIVAAAPKPAAPVVSAGSSAVASAGAPPPAPAVAALPASAKFKLQGIIYNPARPWAIVNGRTVYTGDRIGEFRVLAISKNTLTLENGMRTNVLNLGK